MKSSQEVEVAPGQTMGHRLTIVKARQISHQVVAVKRSRWVAPAQSVPKLNPTVVFVTVPAPSRRDGRAIVALSGETQSRCEIDLGSARPLDYNALGRDGENSGSKLTGIHDDPF